jgi:maltose O-acetyltransferase
LPLKSLNQLRKLRQGITGIRKLWLRTTQGIHFGEDVSLSLTTRISSGRRNSVSIGAESLLAFKTLIYTWDDLQARDRPVRIGRRCFIGGGSMILPGVTIGDE